MQHNVYVGNVAIFDLLTGMYMLINYGYYTVNTDK